MERPCLLSWKRKKSLLLAVVAKKPLAQEVGGSFDEVGAPCRGRPSLSFAGLRVSFFIVITRTMSFPVVLSLPVSNK